MVKNPIILSEITGVIAQLTTERMGCVVGEKKDYKKFFELCHTDIPIIEMIDVLKLFAEKNYEIVFCTSRPEIYREVTLEWLSKIGFGKCRLLMRKDEDRRDITLVKPFLLAYACIKPKDIHMAFDGYGTMCRKWRELGITALMTQPRVNRR